MINNEFYKELGDKWYTSEGDAIALLRLENETKAPWVAEQIGAPPKQILDIGCGGGFLCRHLADLGHQVTGMDVDESVLASGRARDTKAQIEWRTGRAETLPFADKSFDVVCIMDVLEHIESPRQALLEATRVLRDDGMLLFHTFNRTPLAWLLAAKGLDWFLRDTYQHIHEYRLFIKPHELEGYLRENKWKVTKWQGISPKIRSALKLILKRRTPRDFEFRLGQSLSVGYLGVALKV